MIIISDYMDKNENCGDQKCFIHGDVKVRGQVLTGIVVSAKAKRTAIIERPRTIYFPKYKRYARTRSKLAAHNPACISAKVGDIVKVGECRKLSRTKTWTITEIVKKNEEKS